MIFSNLAWPYSGVRLPQQLRPIWYCKVRFLNEIIMIIKSPLQMNLCLLRKFVDKLFNSAVMYILVYVYNEILLELRQTP